MSNDHETLTQFCIHALLWIRMRRALDVQKNVDDDRIEMLERMIREASDTVMESERKYEEVQLSQQHCMAEIYTHYIAAGMFFNVFL